MNKHRVIPVPGLLRARFIYMVLTVSIVATLVGYPGETLGSQAGNVAHAGPVHMPPSTVNRDLFGMVIRDPFYEYNTDPVNYKEAPNRTALEQEAREISAAGAKWIRMEFFADYDGSVQPGEINWAKYDWFINELAPKYGLKVLALLNVGMVAYNGQTVRTTAFNDPADNGGSNPGDGTNHFIRVFTARAQYIAARYGANIAAYEIVNEPNISYDLWLDSRNSSAEIKPERYAALMTSAYRAIKGVSSEAQVIIGGLMLGSPPEGQDHDQFDYLYQLYVSQWVNQYRASGMSSRPGWSSVPWDGVAMHPYFLDMTKLFAFLKDFVRKMRDRGDFSSKIWITEIGAEAKPPSGPSERPNQDEINQAYYLRSLYGGILADNELQSIIAHVFWFKYEDFVPGDYTHNYGLVRLAENATGDGYSTTGQVYIHKLAYQTYQELAFGYQVTDKMQPEDAPVGSLYFSDTAQAIAPEFGSYWEQNGGLGRFGYPISRPVMANGGYLSQFFQRAVFEYHPEYEGTPNAVLLRLVGDEYTAGQKFNKADTSSLPPDRTYFPASGHSLGGVFLNYWLANGGLAIYGYPITEEIQEVSPTDGQTYTVQYFERNRFEYHPEATGTPYEVQLGLLGSNLLKENRWWR